MSARAELNTALHALHRPVPHGCSISRETRLSSAGSDTIVSRCHLDTYHARPRLHKAKGVPHSVERPLLLVPPM